MEEMEGLPDSQTTAHPQHMAAAAREVLLDCKETKEFADALPMEVYVVLGVEMHKAAIEKMNAAGELLKKTISDSAST